ncbi:hypothetical protein M272_00845 [Vibrio natriegens NBRC 15636 = ATCC 14048 = DSM 759]|nr:hypothetical protein M272_00845 [Vibrio natriegens NBRC 15636 = ATCC 14048 = DSM 759]
MPVNYCQVIAQEKSLRARLICSNWVEFPDMQKRAVQAQPEIVTQLLEYT